MGDSMAANKTKLTEASVKDYLGAIEDGARKKDCEALAKLMAKVTGEKAKMWGTAIVGFGVHRYKYESGREGEICKLGFSSRKADITVYGTSSNPAKEKLLAKLGKHKTGKGCLYIHKLSEVDLKVLEQLLAGVVKA
jgi:hypothetical protein